VKSQVDLSFAHNWHAEILPARPAILPARHFVYPRDAEEVERGALEVMVRPGSIGPGISAHLGPVLSQVLKSGPGAPGDRATKALPFLATCALGFRDPAVPTGVWSAPNPCELCAVSGGYAYIIDTMSPERFTMIEFRPVLEVRSVTDAQLLLFAGHREITAWGADGVAWKSEKLSDEGVTITKIVDGVLHGTGWEMMTDKERPFEVDLRSGLVISI
jgi:hypothetical protein